MADGQQSISGSPGLSVWQKIARRVVIDGTDAYLDGLTKYEGQWLYNTDSEGYEGYDGTSRSLIAHKRLGIHLADDGGTQTIPDDTLTALQFGTKAEYPTGVTWESGFVVTVPSNWGGLYIITLQVYCGSAVGAGSYINIHSDASGGVDLTCSMDTFATAQVMTVCKRIAAGEQITPQIKQKSGGSIAVTSRLDMYRLGA